MAGGLLEVFDALLTLAKRLETARQVVLRDNGKLYARFVSSSAHVRRFLTGIRTGSLRRFSAAISGDTDTRGLEDLVDF